MLGAIIGDIAGSRFEWNNHKSKDFEFLTYKCFPTDDSIMTLALAKAILISKPDHSDLAENAMAEDSAGGFSQIILSRITAMGMARQCG